MFIRIYRPNEGMELLVNTSHISKIEVQYGVRGADGNYHKTSLEEGLKNAEAVRFYRVYVSGEELFLVADPSDPVAKIFDDIYRSAVKA